MVISLKKIIDKLNKKQKNKAHLLHLDKQHDVSSLFSNLILTPTGRGIERWHIFQQSIQHRIRSRQEGLLGSQNHEDEHAKPKYLRCQIGQLKYQGKSYY
jgi:hypothetical protein